MFYHFVSWAVSRNAETRFRWGLISRIDRVSIVLDCFETAWIKHFSLQTPILVEVVTYTFDDGFGFGSEHASALCF
jgi:hypothetical protein